MLLISIMFGIEEDILAGSDEFLFRNKMANSLLFTFFAIYVLFTIKDKFFNAMI